LNMNYELNEDTFFVSEILNPKLANEGKYNYYLIEKAGVSHKELKRILPIGYYCGKKDRNATTKQWFCTEHEIGEIQNEKVRVEFKGRSNERLHIGKHKGNKFRVQIELDDGEIEILKSINFNKKKVCNYFGKQRFEERLFEFSRLIDLNSWEKALKYFLTHESKFDTPKSTEIKKIIINNWGNWKEIISNEKIPSSKKPLFEFLEKEEDFKGAFEFVERKSLKNSLRAIQALRFNLLLENEAIDKKENGIKGEINGEELIIEASKAFKRELFVKPTEFEKNFGENGMGRKTFFQPKNFRIKNLGSEVWIEFDLGKGNYATVFLEFLKGYLKSKY
jgi:tRNA(Glu) U13 pseudouridine synthase TruD